MVFEQDIDQEFETNFINGIAAMETGISEMPYFVQHENGEVMFLTAEDGAVTGAQYQF